MREHWCVYLSALNSIAALQAAVNRLQSGNLGICPVGKTLELPSVSGRMFQPPAAVRED